MKYGKYAEFLPDGIVCSCDSVVVDYKFDKISVQELLNWISSKVLWMYEHSERFSGIGKFKHSFTFDFGESSTATLLVGLYGASGVTPQVRLDFNPNKISCSDLDELIMYLRLHCKSASLVRWDLAVDYPDPRRNFLLIRTDKRKRGLEETSADNITEYLGRRNCAGRYKLYNKTIESGLDCDLTRSELTCAGSWTPQECLDKLPVLLRFEPFSEDGVKQYASGADLVLCMEMIMHPEDAYLLDMLDKRKRKSLRNILEQCSADSSSCHSVLGVSVVAQILDGICKDILA